MLQTQLDEVSLTPMPANPQALVTARYPVPAARQFYSMMQQRVGLVAQMTQILARHQKELLTMTMTLAQCLNMMIYTSQLAGALSELTDNSAYMRLLRQMLEYR